MKLAEGTQLGRMGKQMLSVVWPTAAIRFVELSAVYPHSGERLLVVRATAPEIRGPFEVHFPLQETKQADMFARKCLIVLASWQLTGEIGSNRKFFARAKELYDAQLPNGLDPPKYEPAVVHQERRDLPRKIF